MYFFSSSSDDEEEDQSRKVYKPRPRWFRSEKLSNLLRDLDRQYKQRKVPDFRLLRHNTSEEARISTSDSQRELCLTSKLMLQVHEKICPLNLSREWHDSSLAERASSSSNDGNDESNCDDIKMSSPPRLPLHSSAQEVSPEKLQSPTLQLGVVRKRVDEEISEARDTKRPLLSTQVQMTAKQLVVRGRQVHATNP